MGIRSGYDKNLKLVLKFVTRVFPEVDRRIGQCLVRCRQSEDPRLKEQGLASIHAKKFHAQGGSVYALYPKADLKAAAAFIVCFQTISDYLDNLCDRLDIQQESAFRQLHRSLLDAVTPEAPMEDYYSLFPYSRDGNYLRHLVEQCRQQVVRLSSFPLVAETLRRYVTLYSEMQTYKHLARGAREFKLLKWASSHLYSYPEITRWEFAAAAGSTLGVFTLFVSAFDPGLSEETVRSLDSAYFPWICGLHILLDYYIDAREDMETGDLNFTDHYDTLKECEERLCFFTDRALAACRTLPYPDFHETVVKGLLSMYLSDPKAGFGMNRITSGNLLKNGGKGVRVYYRLCRLLRLAGKL